MLFNWIMVNFISCHKLKIPSGHFTNFSTTRKPRIESIEIVRQHIKQELSWEIYEDLDEITEKVRAFIENNFSLLTIASITGGDYIRSVLLLLYHFGEAV